MEDVLAQLISLAQYKVDITPLPDTKATPAKIADVTRIIFTIIGALSVLMMTIGGMRYVASQGDPQATAKAKGTIIYALIGVVVAISAISIVTFVLGNI